MRRTACIISPDSYFALVLLLEAGLFGSFTALNFFHWFLFWELSLIPAFFLIKLWGGPKRGPAATQFFVYTMAGSWRCCWRSSRSSSPPASMDFGDLAAMAANGTLDAGGHRASVGPVMMWLAIGVLAGFAVKVPLVPFHTWLPAAYAEAPSPVTMLLTGAMSKMGVYGLLRIALPIFGPQIAQIRTPLLVLAVRNRRDGRVGGGGAEGSEARLRVLIGESPGLLPARHLRTRGAIARRELHKPARQQR